MAKKNKKRIHRLKQKQHQKKTIVKYTVSNVKELLDLRDNMIYSYINGYKDNSYEEDRLTYIMVGACDYLDYKYHELDNNPRLPLKPYYNQYILVKGFVGPIKNFNGTKRLCILKPKIMGTLDGDPYNPETKAIEEYPDFNPIKIDSHIWIDIDKLDTHERNLAARSILTGEMLVIGCRVFSYHGSIDKDNNKGVKYGIRRGWILANGLYDMGLYYRNEFQDFTTLRYKNGKYHTVSRIDPYRPLLDSLFAKYSIHPDYKNNLEKIKLAILKQVFDLATRTEKIEIPYVYWKAITEKIYGDNLDDYHRKNLTPLKQLEELAIQDEKWYNTIKAFKCDPPKIKAHKQKKT